MFSKKGEAVIRPSEDILQQSLQKWGLRGQPQFIRNNENCVYALPEEPVILRFTSVLHRSLSELAGELQWIQSLADFGCEGLSHPVKARDGSYLSTFNLNGQEIFASVFIKAKGSPITDHSGYQSETYLQLGRLIGKMHRFEKQNPNDFSRKSWAADGGFQLAKAAASSADGKNYEVFQSALAWLNTLPADRSSFGLIHSDIHQGNFFVDDVGKIHLFDFDDGQRHWFAYDLATTLFSLEFSGFQEGLQKDVCDACRDALLEGYKEEYDLESFWFETLPNFKIFRTVLLYFWAKARIAKGQVEPESRVKIIAMMATCSKSLQDFRGFAPSNPP